MDYTEFTNEQLEALLHHSLEIMHIIAAAVQPDQHLLHYHIDEYCSASAISVNAFMALRERKIKEVIAQAN